MKNISFCFVIVALAVLSFSATTKSQAQSCGSIQTYQATPTVPREREAFTITTTGEWCVNVTNTSSSVEVLDNIITVTVTITGGILQVVSPWSMSVNMENVRHGKYTVVVRLNNASGGQVDQQSYSLEIKGGKGKP